MLCLNTLIERVNRSAFLLIPLWLLKERFLRMQLISVSQTNRLSLLISWQPVQICHPLFVCILWKNFGENQNALCLKTESGLKKKQTSKNGQDRESGDILEWWLTTPVKLTQCVVQITWARHWRINGRVSFLSSLWRGPQARSTNVQKGANSLHYGLNKLVQQSIF